MWAFVVAVFSEAWIYFAYGGGAVMLTLWGYATAQTPPAWVFLAVLALGFFVGGFRTWQKERIERNSRVGELLSSHNLILTLQQAKRPDLLCKVEDCQQLLFQMGPRDGYGSNILLKLTLRNVGAKTALSDWRLEIPSIGTAAIEPRSDPWSDMLFKQNRLADLLKTSQFGIGQGDIVQGVLIFTVPGLTKEKGEHIDRLIVTFMDALGETHAAEWRKPPLIGTLEGA